MKNAKREQMRSTQCYAFNKTFHIVIPQRKDGCANFIITLFHLIKCMIIPQREIRGQDMTGRGEDDNAVIKQPSVLLGYVL